MNVNIDVVHSSILRTKLRQFEWNAKAPLAMLVFNYCFKTHWTEKLDDPPFTSPPLKPFKYFNLMTRKRATPTLDTGRKPTLFNRDSNQGSKETIKLKFISVQV